MQVYTHKDETYHNICRLFIKTKPTVTSKSMVESNGCMFYVSNMQLQTHSNSLCKQLSKEKKFKREIQNMTPSLQSLGIDELNRPRIEFPI